MQITVYLDLIFILNFLVDFYVLLITGHIVHQKISLLKIGLGALFGSLAFLPFIFCPKLLVGLSGLILSIVINIGAVGISLGISGGFIKKWLLSTTITFLLGGLIQFYKNKSEVIHISFYKWTIIFFISMITGLILFRHLSSCSEKRKYIYVIKMHHAGKNYEENVFMDSGNQLWDCLYGKPVLILSDKVIERIVSAKEFEYIKKYSKVGFMDYGDPLLNEQKNICFHEISYQSVGKSRGKLLCFIIDSVEVVGRDKVYLKQPIAVVDGNMFRGKMYNGLIFSDDN